jgi:hypothetical protein
MVRCSVCDQSRWVHVKTGGLVDRLERIAGGRPYWCQSCERYGWHRSRSTVPALDELRRLGRRGWTAVLACTQLARRLWSNRPSIAMPRGRRLATLCGLAFIFALGLWIGGLLFSGPAVSAPRESVAAVNAAAPEPAVTPPVAPSVSPSVPAAAAAVAPAASQVPAATIPPAPSPAPKLKSTGHARLGSETSSPLPKFQGSLAIRSQPLGALVSLDGQVVGKTPIVLKGVRAGSRVLRIESEGYERWSSAARVVANRETAIVATLQRN